MNLDEKRSARIGLALVAAMASGWVAAGFAAPITPSELKASAVSPTRIDLKWQDNSDNESAFVIERRDAAGSEWKVVWAELNRDFPQLEDMALTPGAEYSYRVKARGRDGADSPASNVVAATTPTAPPLYNNLLRDRLAIASTYQWRKVPARQAVDGTQWTRWQSKITKENIPQIDWLQVDMGSRQSFDKVRIIWQRGSWALSYELQASDDAMTWNTIKRVEKSAVQVIEVLQFPPVTARYVRIHCLESANKQLSWGGYGGYSIYEFEAYAPGVAPDSLEWEDSAAFMKPATATQRPQLISGAVDSHLGTFWSMKHDRETSLIVDLGSEQDIYAIIPYWHVPPTAYELRVSSDRVNWRTVANQGGMQVTPVENEELREIHTKSFAVPERGRHVRVVVTGKAIHADPKFTSVILQELLVHSAAVGVPRAPRDLRAVVGATNQVTLAWSDASADETGFQVHRRNIGTSDWREIGTVGRDGTRFDDRPAGPGMHFVYRVVAVNAMGASLPSNLARVSF